MHAVNIERWLVRLAKAAELLDGRLDNPPTLDELAAAAAVSPFNPSYPVLNAGSA